MRGHAAAPRPILLWICFCLLLGTVGFALVTIEGHRRELAELESRLAEAERQSAETLNALRDRIEAATEAPGIETIPEARMTLRYRDPGTAQWLSLPAEGVAAPAFKRAAALLPEVVSPDRRSALMRRILEDYPPYFTQRRVRNFCVRVAPEGAVPRHVCYDAAYRPGGLSGVVPNDFMPPVVAAAFGEREAIIPR